MSGYTPQTWIDGNLAYPPSAARFLVMEDGIFRAHAQVVSSLPTVTFFDGEIVVARVPTRAQATESFWTFRHDSINSTAQVWAFTGGAPAGDETGASFATASTTYVADGTNGPRVTVPFLGWYQVTYGALVSNSTVNAFSTMSLAYGAAPIAADEVRYVSPTANAAASVMRTRAILISSLNQLIEVQYGVSAGTGTFLNRFMYVTPIRCGP